MPLVSFLPAAPPQRTEADTEGETAYESHTITTRSNPSAFPSALRQKKTSLVQQREVEKKKVYVRCVPNFASAQLPC